MVRQGMKSFYEELKDRSKKRIALLVDPDDVDGLSQALVRVLRDDGLADRLGAGGRARWTRFDWSIIGGRFLAEVSDT